MRYFIFFFACLIISCAPTGGGSGSSDGVLDGLDHRPGFLDLYVDENSNAVFTKLPLADEDGVVLSAIHSARLTAGLGSNPVGLDRGWGESGRIVDFVRRGDTIILQQRNLNYRASPDNPLEERAVSESFAMSFLAAFEIKESLSDGLVIEMTDFLTADSLNLVQYLRDADQGSFSIASDRTLVDTSQVLSFPDNTEVDVFFTLSSADPGREVATTAANGRDATLVQHHSFARLPDDGYEILKSDPRAAAIEVTYQDYSAPLSAPIQTRLARRYRIETDESGAVINPIIFYIDSGAPEPIRSALVEGACWWEDAFAAAGYPDAYRVEILPEEAHPLDIRFNVVQWVHRQTRGWSYGGGVYDPRTGEMLKGHVNLGSLRVRQDRMIFEGLLGAAKTNSGEPDDPVELALARIRQLSAHEVGHALGFMHNFAASSDNKASVMDYPAPDVRVVNGQLDVSNAYGVGIGDWDKVTANWLYGDHTPEERDAILREAYDNGLSYVADSDGRGIGTGHPEGSVWDNGSDPVATLREVMEVRRIALDRFGPDNLPDGWNQSDLNGAFVPIYLYHRYQTAAAGKLIGGQYFDYGLSNSAEPATIVGPERQREALEAVLTTIEPEALDIPDATLNRLMPILQSFSAFDNDRELFRKSAYPAFDTISAAETAADLTFDVLLHPQRATRLVEFHRRDAANPSFEVVLETTRRTVMRSRSDDRLGEIADAVRTRYAYALMELAESDASPSVRSIAMAGLGDLKASLRTRNGDAAQWLADEIERFEERPATPTPQTRPAQTLPPGSPIGESCWHCD